MCLDRDDRFYLDVKCGHECAGRELPQVVIAIRDHTFNIQNLTTKAKEIKIT